MKPLLHPSQKKFTLYISLVLAFLAAMSPLAIDTYLAAMPIMASDLQVGLGKIEITLTVYFLGFAFGNFIGGPFSDSFGRKPIATTGIILYGLSAFIITQASSIELIWALRFLQAFGGGFASVTVMVFVRDWFQGKQVAKLATIISMIMMFAPLLAPVIGSVLLVAWNWQAIFFFMCIYACAMLLIFTLMMPESRPREMITRKHNSQQFFSKYAQFFRNRLAVLTLFTISFSVSGMFAFITGASFIYLDYFNMPPHIFPVLFGTNVALNVILSLLNTVLLKRYESRTILRIGLIVQLLASILFVAGALVGKTSFWAIYSAIVLYIGSLGLIFGNGNAIILNLVPEISGSANATIGVTRFILSSVAGTIPALFIKTDLIPTGAVMFTCAVVANIFFFYFMRQHKKIAQLA